MRQTYIILHLFFLFKVKYNINIEEGVKNGIYYYCNIASPTILEGKVIKYIDYDLDLRGFPDGSYKILDESEYEYHRKKMNYPDEIDIIVKRELRKLIKLYEKGIGPFDKERVKKYYEDVCLLNQHFVKNPDLTISQLLTEATLKIGEKISVRRFVRYELGEGMEKRNDNLAEEVAKQMAGNK